MKIQEIRKMAKALQINSFGKSKADLIREIQRKEGNFDCFGRAAGYCDQVACCFRSLCLPEEKPSKAERGPKRV